MSGVDISERNSARGQRCCQPVRFMKHSFSSYSGYRMSPYTCGVEEFFILKMFLILVLKAQKYFLSLYKKVQHTLPNRDKNAVSFKSNTFNIFWSFLLKLWNILNDMFNFKQNTWHLCSWKSHAACLDFLNHCFKRDIPLWRSYTK